MGLRESNYVMNYIFRDTYTVAVHMVYCMPPLDSMGRRVVETLRQPTNIAAAAAVVVAVASVGYGLTNDDLLTALGAFLIVPSIVLLYLIANQSDVEVDTDRQRQAN